MRKILIIFLVFMSVTACQKLDNLNANLKDFTTVPGEGIYNGATRALLNQMFTPNVNNNNTMLFVQYFAETTYPDESRYDMVTRTIPANHMNTLYRNALMNYKEAARVLNATSLSGTTITQAQRDNQLAIIEIMSVFAWSNLVETFGDIPYTESLDYATKPNPKYDDGLTIYKDLINRLNTAIAKLDPTSPGMGAGYDNVFGGGVAGTAKWIRFANTLKLRMGLMISDISSETALAKTTVEAAAPNVFNVPITSPTTGDKFAMTYLKDSPNTTPMYTELVLSGRKDYVVTSVYVNALNALNDPRRDGFMWTKIQHKDIAGLDSVLNYFGGAQGMPNGYNSFTHVNNALLDPTREVVLMDYTEAEFLLAEAAERGFTVVGSAQSHYNNAITSSILYWGRSIADAATYLAQPAVAYTTATGTWRQKVGTQAWLGYYFRGFAAWTTWRRLDYPHLIASPKHVLAVNGIPERYIYPVSEQNLNGANYTTAAAAIGGDKAETRLFWDKGPENYDSSFN
jgi:Starch-binding associating with outer membrane